MQVRYIFFDNTTLVTNFDCELNVSLFLNKKLSYFLWLSIIRHYHDHQEKENCMNNSKIFCTQPRIAIVVLENHKSAFKPKNIMVIIS